MRPRGVRPASSFARIARRYGAGQSARKQQRMAVLARTRLRTADQVRVLHETLCFLEAYPDDERVRRAARQMLLEFHDRADLKRHRHALAGSGIAGADIPFRFFWPTARWISRQWPGSLVLDRSDPDHAQAILDALPQLLEPAQADWLRSQRKPTLAVLDRLRPRGVTDAEYLVGLVEAIPCEEAQREAFFDRVDPPFVLRSGSETPERTTARLQFIPNVARPDGPVRRRPDLRREARRPPQAIRPLLQREARSLVRQARIAMITRERDVAVFQYPNLRDSLLIDDGDGLAFALIGSERSRRSVLYATYAGLTLQNGVPVGYVQLEALGRHAAISFNTFETFRGGEAARVLARLIAAARHVFGSEVFSIEPYQLGEGNEEGIESAAWWFYQRNGFRPKAREARRIARREIRRSRSAPGYRSTKRSLRRLAHWHVFYSLTPGHRMGLPRTEKLLQAAIRELRTFGPAHSAKRRSAAASAARVALDAGTFPLGAEKTLADWAGIVLALARRGRLPVKQRRTLLAVIKARAGVRERDYQQLLRRHAALCRLLNC